MKPWYTLAEVAALLHVGIRTTRRLLAPYREQCHLARKGRHPRLVLWVPVEVFAEIRKKRGDVWRDVA